MRANRFLYLSILIFALGSCRQAFAHPMGNFSVNHYSRITLQPDRLRIHYLIDLAEIPTYQELQQANLQPNAIDASSPAVLAYVAHRGELLGQGLLLNVDGKSVSLNLVASNVIFPPGAGGLPTMKMGFEYEARYPSVASALDAYRRSLHYSDTNYEGHTGWKEIVANPSASLLLSSSVPTTDRSRELSNYPTDLLTSPPQLLEASLVVASSLASSAISGTSNAPLPQKQQASQARVAPTVAKGLEGRPSHKSLVPHELKSPQTSQPAAFNPGSLTLQANRQQTPRNKFTELIQAQNLSGWFLFTAAFIAIGLGGLHALEPGHGKTIVAAYLVGSKGTARHAALLGLIVTASHTLGVFALGAVTLYLSRYIVPEQLYPWLGALSGITIVGLGTYMLLRRLTGTASEHSHAPGSSHSHWFFSKRNSNADAKVTDPIQTISPAQSVSLAQLFTLGITGGIIPCPAALIVLLSAFALHRIGLGFFLIVAFSAGLAGVLIGFGMLMVYARRFISHLQIDGPLTRRWLPVASSAFITVLGMILTVQALANLHLSPHLLSREKLGPLLFVAGLGLILGMRHSTDADHVAAISTIVSKQKSIRGAAIIGSIWGLGHTITIFIVGSLIILFGVEIPPRLGLSMEFCVALMLILLGVLNLTGVMRKITSFFNPAVGQADTLVAPTPQDEPNPAPHKLLKNLVGSLGLFQTARPLVIGLVHGLAGSAAVALLVLSTIHNPVWASLYLLIFGAGTMLGMMVMTSAIAAPLSFAGEKSKKLSQYFGVVSGMVSLCFGTFLVYQLGFLGGLFTSHPHWTPQ